MCSSSLRYKALNEARNIAVFPPGATPFLHASAEEGRLALNLGIFGFFQAFRQGGESSKGFEVL
jgi:hypothetical protein